jgi:hypothetical protein
MCGVRAAPLFTPSATPSVARSDYGFGLRIRGFFVIRQPVACLPVGCSLLYVSLLSFYPIFVLLHRWWLMLSDPLLLNCSSRSRRLQYVSA